MWRIFFARRRNEDKTWESVCPTCFHTVASGGPESQLTQTEEAHVCEQQGIYAVTPTIH
jgi:hypothetical protein